MSGFVRGYYRFCLWTMRLAYVNILWVAFTLLGLAIFGFMPATAGMFAVVRKWVMGDKDIAIFETFWHSYKKEFFKANLLGIILFAIGYILSMEFQILRTQEGMAYYLASYGVIAIMVLYAIVLVYFFPIFVHFHLRTLQYIQWPFIIGVIHPILTIFLLVGVLVIHYIVYVTIPALLFFFGGSVTAIILMWGVSQTFPKFEAKEVD